MDADTTESATTAPAHPARPNVLAFVAPTTVRFLVLIGALVSTGLFLGTWTHNSSHLGLEWTRRIVECHQSAASAPADWMERHQLERRCQAGVETRRFAFAVGGAAATLGAGIVVMLFTPVVIERRRRLRTASSRVAPAVDRFRDLARESGLTHEPRLMLGPPALHDAFSYGLPGRYRVAMPPAVLVRWRDKSTFDPLVRHELAHVQHHDVPLAWVARSTWLVVLPLLAIPVVGSVVRGDYPLLGSYLWRATMLALVSLLAAAALLRSREFDADVRAAPDAAAMAGLQNLLARVSDRTRPRWRRLFAYHPSGRDRIAILERPQNHAVMSFSDGLTAAFFACLTLPLLESAISIIRTDLTVALVAVSVGSLLGAAVGLGLWRQSVVRRVAETPSVVVAPTVGVIVGSTLGSMASLGQTATGTVGGFEHLTANLVLPLALAGATLITAGVGEIFADASGRFRRPRSAWVTCVLVAATIFAAAVAIAMILALFVDQAGWPLVRVLMVSTLSGREPAIVSIALALVVTLLLLWTRRPAPAPSWAVLDGRPSPVCGASPGLLGAVLVGLTAGGVGALMIAGARLIFGPAQTDAERISRADLSTWIMAAAGAAAAMALVVRQPSRGLGVALLCSPVASLTTAAGLLALNTALGGSLPLAFLEAVIRPGLGLGLTLTIAVGAASLGLHLRRGRDAPGVVATACVAGLLAALATTGVLAGRTAILPGATSSSPTPSVVPRDLYKDVVARPLLDGRMAEVQAMRELQMSNPSNAVAAQRIRTEILPLVEQMRVGAESVQLDDPVVQAVHAHAIAGARLHVDGLSRIASGLDSNDRAELERGNALLQDGNEEWAQWAGGAEGL